MIIQPERCPTFGRGRMPLRDACSQNLKNFTWLTNVFWGNGFGKECLVFAPAGIWTRVSGSRGPHTWPGYSRRLFSWGSTGAVGMFHLRSIIKLAGALFNCINRRCSWRVLL